MQTERQSDKDWPLWLFASCTGAFSLLAMIDDADLVKLEKSRLGAWVKAYSVFVGKVTHFMFDYRWIHISTNEGHILVLTLILAMGVMRATRRRCIKNGTQVMPHMVILFLVIFLPVF